MKKSEMWSVIWEERKALSSDLEGLDEAAWTSKSLCEDWSAQMVLAHMTAAAKMTPLGFFPMMIGTGFNFNSVQKKGIAREIGSSPLETLSNFKSIEKSVKHPPGPMLTMLGEAFIHAEDIRRPLGLKRKYPSEPLVAIANFYKGSNMIIGAKRRIEGVAIKATDADFQTGSGPSVEGPIISIVMAMTGRKIALSDLSGEGVEQVKTRP